MKRKHAFLLKTALYGLLLTCILSSCSKSAKEEPDENNNNECEVPVHFKGWGTCSYDAPEGTPLTLPKGLSFVWAEHPRTFDQKDSCAYKDEGDPHRWDVGSHVTLCVSFRNSTNTPLNLVLPPGLIFVSRDQESQNGILAMRVAVTVPANTTVYNQLNMHCINGSKSTSGDSKLNYTLGPITSVKPAKELITFLEGKNIKKAPNSIRAGISIAFSDIDSKGFIRESTWDILKQLPNK